MVKTKNLVVIGIDESYDRTGITVLNNKEILELVSLDLSCVDNNSLKRMKIQRVLRKLILKYRPKENGKMIIVVERIRLFSRGFVSFNYIKSTGALVGAIIDEAYKVGIKVFSVDTRAWKTRVLGSTKKVKNVWGVPEEKWLSVKFCLKLGLAEDLKLPITSNRIKKGVFISPKDGKKYRLDHDLADSVCIATAGLRMYVEKSDLLQLEE